MLKKALLPILLMIALIVVLAVLAFLGERKGWESFFTGR